MTNISLAQPVDLDILRKHATSGLSMNQVSKLVGIHGSTIKRLANRHNIEFIQAIKPMDLDLLRADAASGLSLCAAAKKQELSWDRANNAALRHGIKFKHYRPKTINVDHLIALVKNGKTQVQIAGILKCSKVTISRRCKELELTPVHDVFANKLAPVEAPPAKRSDFSCSPAAISRFNQTTGRL